MAEDWLEAARKQAGTWWADWDEWLAKRSGPERKAPAALGAKGFKAAEPAPGTYVFG